MTSSNRPLIAHTLVDYAPEDIFIFRPRDVKLQLKHDRELGLIGIYRDSRRNYWQEVIVEYEDIKYACVAKIDTFGNRLELFKGKLLLIDTRSVEFEHDLRLLSDTKLTEFWKQLEKAK